MNIKSKWILKVNKNYIWNQLKKCVQIYFLIRAINEINM
jgi:hypothetical protein